MGVVLNNAAVPDQYSTDQGQPGVLYCGLADEGWFSVNNAAVYAQIARRQGVSWDSEEVYCPPGQYPVAGTFFGCRFRNAVVGRIAQVTAYGRESTEGAGIMVASSQPSQTISATGEVVSDVGVATPIGSVMAYGGTGAPSNWVLCDGTLYDPHGYPALFAILGTRYGGDGVATFGVPDLRGRFPLGAGAGPGLTARALNDKGGEQSHALSLGELPDLRQRSANTTAADAASQAGDNNDGLLNSASFAGSARGSTMGGGQGHNTMPPYTALNFIMRAI